MPVASSWTTVGTFDEVAPAINGTLQSLLDHMDSELEQGSRLVFRALLTLDINLSSVNLNSKSDAAKKTSEACNSSPLDQITQSTFGHNFEFDLSPFYRRKTKENKEKTATINVSFLPLQPLFIPTDLRPYR